MPKDKQPQKEQIKVTDKRIFTPDGDIREEFREQITPAGPSQQRETEPQGKSPEVRPAETRPQNRTNDKNQEAAAQAERDRRGRMGDRAENPGTPFTNFLEPLIAQAYMSLGMLPNPYQVQQSKIDAGAARQMIDILTLLQQKTAGNLTPDEEDFLNTYIGELKLAFVKITKSI